MIGGSRLLAVSSLPPPEKNYKTHRNDSEEKKKLALPLSIARSVVDYNSFK